MAWPELGKDLVLGCPEYLSPVGGYWGQLLGIFIPGLENTLVAGLVWHSPSYLGLC